MSVSALEFTQKLSAQPKSEQERAAILADPGFGNHFTDHTAVIDYRVTETGQGIWENARIEPYGPIAMDPAASVLHYGQEIFEGLKAYRHGRTGVPRKRITSTNRKAGAEAAMRRKTWENS